MDASASDEDVGAVLKVSGQVDDWTPMGRGFRLLQSRHLEAQIGERGCALTRELVVCWRH